MLVFVYTHFRKWTGRTWQPRRCRPRSSQWFGTSWTSATSPRSSQRWTPPTPPRLCLRTATASFRWVGAKRRRSSRTAFCGRLRFLRVIAQDEPHARRCCFVPMFVRASVAGGVTCWHLWKISLHIITFFSAIIFDILHSNRSNQVKFWMSSKGCCKSTWVCLCALVFKLTKGPFYLSNCCHMQLLLKKQMWMTIFDVALNHNMAQNSVPADGCLMYCMKFQLWLPSGSLSSVDQ